MNALDFDVAHFRKVISKSRHAEPVPSANQLLAEATRIFHEEFDYYPSLAVCAPGTFTIMGDYADVAGGLTMQAALPLQTLMVGRHHDAPKCRVMTCSAAADLPRRIVFPIARCGKLKKGYPLWGNPLKGVTNIFLPKNRTGFDVLIHSNIPISRCFGSSAAMEAAFFTLLESAPQNDLKIGKADKAKKCRIVDEKFGETKGGAFTAYTVFHADTRKAVVLDTHNGEVECLPFRDPNILFLLSLPTTELLHHPQDLIRIRETELKLAAKLLDLAHIRDADESHLRALAAMEDPSREKVTAILRQFEKDEGYISAFVEEFFTTPKVDAVSDGGVASYLGEELYFEAPGEAAESSPPEAFAGESFTEFEYRTVCDETVCLGGLSDLSVRSDLTAVSKLARRLRYVLGENLRLRSVVRHVNDLDFVSAGVELTRSHLSLKVDFEVSSPEMDELVQFTGEMTGVYGSKMMRNGGTLTLVHRNHSRSIIDSIKKRFGDVFQFYLAFPSRGLRKVNVLPPLPPRSFLSETYPSMEALFKRAMQNFEATYRRLPTHGYFAPEVVKVLGDHSSYNHTYALSMSLAMGTIVVGAVNGSGKIRAATTADVGRQPSKVIFQIPSVKELTPGSVKWANCIRGVVSYFRGPIPGFDCLVEASVPAGCRLPNSTSVLVAAHGFLQELTGFRAENHLEAAAECMRAEHAFTTSFGGTDDFIVSLKGLQERMVLIDCKKSKFSYLPSLDPSYVFVLVSFGGPGSIGKQVVYMRLEECYDVARALGLASLRCAKEEDLDGLTGVSATAIKRARHVLTEERRVLASAAALQQLDAEKFGQLMVDSHVSLRDQFEISRQDLDDVVSRSLEVEGVVGSRMTGSDCGTAVLCLVKSWAADDLMDYIRDTCDGDFTFYVLSPSSGARPLDVRAFVEAMPGPERTFERIFES